MGCMGFNVQERPQTDSQHVRRQKVARKIKAKKIGRLENEERRKLRQGKIKTKKTETKNNSCCPSSVFSRAKFSQRVIQVSDSQVLHSSQASQKPTTLVEPLYHTTTLP